MTPTFRSCLWGMLLIISAACLTSCANNKEREKDVYLPAGDVHEGWYFAAGERVIIQGTVNGDAYVAGGAVRVDGTINGDLLVAGGQVIVSGTVTSNIRATGGTIQIDGDVGRDVTAAGGSITVGKQSSVSGNILAASSDVTITGNIGKEARVATSQLTVLGTVNGTVNFAGKELEVAPGARIQGDLHIAVKDTDDIRIAPGTVQGTIARTIQDKPRETRILGFTPFGLWFSMLWIGSLLLTGLVLVLLFPAQVAGTARTVQQRPGISALWGIIGLLIIPFVAFVLMLTLVGAPVALFVFFVYFFLLYLSQVALGVAVGDRIFHLEGKRMWQLFLPVAAGILIVQLLALIPFLRILILLVELILGFGALLYFIWMEYKRPKTMPA